MIVERAVKPKSILQFITIISLLVLSKQDKRCPNRKQPDLITKITSTSWLCGLPNPIDGLTIEFFKKLSEVTTGTGTQSDNSSIEMKNYFKTVYETRNTVGQIIVACQRIFSTDLISKCVELITTLEKFCFNMSTMESVVLYYIGPSTFQNEIGGLNMIVFLMEHLPNTPDSDSFIMNCFPELTGNDSEYEKLYKTETQINKPAYKDNLKKYKTWWESKPYKPKVYCTCAEIVYIPAFYDKSPQGRLDDYYDEICLKDYKERDSWRESHFLTMLSSNVNIELLGPFLTSASSLAKLGCCTTSSSWPIEYVIKSIALTPTGPDNEFLELVKRAMSTGFTSLDYEEFLQITSMEPFNYWWCKLDIIEKILDVSKADVSDDLKKGVHSKYKGNKKFYVINEKSVFNNHIKFLLEIFLGSNVYKQGCAGFVEYLGYFNEVINASTWSQESITNFLKKGKDQNRDIHTTYACFHFAYQTEYIIKKNNWLKCKDGIKTIQVTDQYDKVFESFRNKLIRKPIEDADPLCCNEHENYNFKTRDNIYKLMKEYIFIKNTGNNLQELFDNEMKKVFVSSVLS